MSRVITFYSYKGGTGRSMALANVAWILASNGKRVLAIDWDLEAPGLHRYFHPFLTDKELSGQELQGVIDMALDFAVRAATPSESGQARSEKWYEQHADFSKWRQRLRWPSGETLRLGGNGKGQIDFVPAGRQGSDYARRVNHFDWHTFYEKLGGGAFFDEARSKFTAYDHVLIDSRTGVSDTSGICTVHMPDTLVVCFTLNHQSIKGALAVALSVREQRPKMRIFPVPMRVDGSEEKLLNRMKNYAASAFTPLLDPTLDAKEYWYSMEVPYFARYAYGEKLALFEERGSITASTLPAMERLTAYVTADEVRTAQPLPENERARALAEFEGSEDAQIARIEARTSFEGSKSPSVITGAAASNIPIAVPLHFLGRDDALEEIDATLKQETGRIAGVTLHGLRGVGKTTLAAAYAERHRADYRATWWIGAQTESTMRADLVALGVRLGWVGADEKEEPALKAVRERLRGGGEGLLLIYDNAIDAPSVRPYLATGSAARALVTSDLPAWRGIAVVVEVRVWPKEVGADYLIARTGRDKERAEAEALSEALGGLPLAHEQAAAHCERLGISLSDYRKRFEAAPARLLDTAKDAPAEYHGGLTVAKAFALAIEEAAKLHPAAGPLIAHAALLAPEPIPLFLFSEAREAFGEPLASQIEGDGLDEAIAALRAFALVDRETIADERDLAIATETIRLHRLVREVAAQRFGGEFAEAARRALVDAMARVYPSQVYDDPSAWPRARRLDALAVDLVAGQDPPPSGAEVGAAYLLDRLASYRQEVLADYAAARPLYERALSLLEQARGIEHPSTATTLNNLGSLLQDEGDFAAARPLFERALAIYEKALGPEHPDTAGSLNELARLLQAQGDLAAARPLFERALAIYEKALGPEHPLTATSLNNLANVLEAQGDLAAARPLFERALAIYEKALGPEHTWTAQSLNDLARLLQAQGDLAGASPLFERALAIREKALGPEHPLTATSLNNLAHLLRDRGDLAGARRLFERALTIREGVLGETHPNTNITRANLALVRLQEGAPSDALALGQAALAAHAKALGTKHAWTKRSATVTAHALDTLGRADEAGAMRAQYGIREEPG